jgi:hypothetical protein
MTIPASAAAVAAAPLPVTATFPNKAGAIASAAQHLLLHLQRGQCVDAPMLRTAMENAFGASDADGAWDWKTAYDTCEAATVLFLRKFGPAMRARADSPAAMLPMLAKIAGLLPTHTRRKRARRFSSLARRSRLVSRRAPRPRSRRGMLCWSHRLARACSPSWPSCRARRSF